MSNLRNLFCMVALFSKAVFLSVSMKSHSPSGFISIRVFQGRSSQIIWPKSLFETDVGDRCSLSILSPWILAHDLKGFGNNDSRIWNSNPCPYLNQYSYYKQNKCQLWYSIGLTELTSQLSRAHFMNQAMDISIMDFTIWPCDTGHAIWTISYGPYHMDHFNNLRHKLWCIN